MALNFIKKVFAKIETAHKFSGSPPSNERKNPLIKAIIN